MNSKILKIFLIPLLLLTLSATSVAGEVSSVIPQTQVETRTLDPRAKVLANYFKKYNSPLENQAQDFIDASDQYGIDWRLVPAISGVESTFGKNSYGFNSWGWGIYGNQALGFKSWKDGIYTVTEGLKTGYINKGLKDPYSINRVYAASPTWGARVSHFMNDLDQLAGKTQPKAQTVNVLSKTYTASAQLAYK